MPKSPSVPRCFSLLPQLLSPVPPTGLPVTWMTQRKAEVEVCAVVVGGNGVLIMFCLGHQVLIVSLELPPGPHTSSLEAKLNYVDSKLKPDGSILNCN